MLCVMVLTIGAVSSLFFVMAHKVKKAEKEPDIFEGLEDIIDPQEKGKLGNLAITSKDQGTTKPKLEKWEKDSDWWKGD